MQGGKERRREGRCIAGDGGEVDGWGIADGRCVWGTYVGRG